MMIACTHGVCDCPGYPSQSAQSTDELKWHGISSVLLLVLNWLQFSIGLPYLLQSGILQNVMSIRFRPVCHRLPLPISGVCRVPSGMSQPFIISIFTSVGNNTSIRIQLTTWSWHKDFLFGTINVLQQKKLTSWAAERSAQTMKLEGHLLFVHNDVPLQLYCPSQASAAHE